MSSAVYRSSPPLSVPPTQNTALVLEFNCLYTHDIRRKQKRWQDGFLRFHTFNKRVMVYDVPRNFIGDMHWRSDVVLQDGDEVMLEGVLVQVGEQIGKTETDLTELRRSGKKAPSEGASSSPVRAAQVPPLQLSNRGGAMNAPQPKHRSLHSLLGTPQRSIGKAVLHTKSPFDKRHGNAENHEWQSGQPPKRRRTTEPLLSNARKSTTTQPVVSASPMKPPIRNASIAPALIPSSSPAFQRQRTPECIPNTQHSTSQDNIPASLKPPFNRSSTSHDHSTTRPKAGPTTQPTPPINPTKPPATATATAPSPSNNPTSAAATAATAPSPRKGTTLRMVASAPKRKTLLFQQQQQTRKPHSPATKNCQAGT